MKKLKLISLFLVPVLMIGCSSQMPTPVGGIYPLKTKTLTIFDLYSNQYKINYNAAEVVESKPEQLFIGFDLNKLTEYRFGSFKFGNNNRLTWFVMGKDAQGYWSDLYIDQNNDLKIKENEKVKSFQSGDDKVKGLDRSQSLSLIPVQIRVAYKGMTGEIWKNLYFFIITTVFSKKGASDIMVQAITASFLDGEIKTVSGDTGKKMSFRLIDANGNGCFNDYGTDLIFIDQNSNNYYHGNEGHHLVEFFNFPVSTNQMKQMRIVIPPYPVKMAVIEANQEFDMLDLEAKSDQEEEKKDPTSEKDNPSIEQSEQPIEE